MSIFLVFELMPIRVNDNQIDMYVLQTPIDEKIFFTAFIRLKGQPFNCVDDISAYYEIEDCGEFDELRSSFHDDNLNCKWDNGPNNGQDCNEFNLQEFGINDGVGKSWYGLLGEKGQLISKANSKLVI